MRSIRALRGCSIAFFAAVSLLASTPSSAWLIGLDYEPFNPGAPLWRIDATTGASSFVASTGVRAVNSLATSPRGELFTVRGYDDQNRFLVRFDPETGAADDAIAISLPIENASSSAIAFAPSGELFIFGTAFLNGVSSKHLFRVDPALGTGTLVANVPLGIQGADFSPAGELYAWSISLGLQIVDVETGAIAQVTTVRIPTGFNIQTLAFTPDGALFGAGGSNLYRIDVDTGSWSLVGTGSYEDIRGLAFIPEPSTGLQLLLGMAGVAALRRGPREDRASAPEAT